MPLKYIMSCFLKTNFKNNRILYFKEKHIDSLLDIFFIFISEQTRFLEDSTKSEETWTKLFVFSLQQLESHAKHKSY